MYAIGRCEHFLNHPSLRWIQKVVQIRIGLGIFSAQDGLCRILALLNMLHSCLFFGDGFSRRELLMAEDPCR